MKAADENDNRKRSIPEPVAHAMIISDFRQFKKQTDYLEMVKVQLEEMKADASVADVIRIGNALILLEFLTAGVHNAHLREGIDEIKQIFIKDAGPTKEAISKSGIVKEMGDV